jgi:hypothetical protein
MRGDKAVALVSAGLFALALAGGLIVSRERLREEWYLYAFRQADTKARWDLAAKLSEMEARAKGIAEDCTHDSAIVAKLAEITQHPEGYGFHRRWFNEGVRQSAVETYREWWKARCSTEGGAPLKSAASKVKPGA